MCTIFKFLVLTTAQRAASKSPLSASHDMTRQDSSHSENSTSNLVSSLTRDMSHDGTYFKKMLKIYIYFLLNINYLFLMKVQQVHLYP